MRWALAFISILSCAAPAAADQFVVGKRGTDSDYPFRGC
jgi:hypothetical protein